MGAGISLGHCPITYGTRWLRKQTKQRKWEKDDPKKIIHSLKVGLAITLVSLFFYFKPTYDGFGVSAMWAVLTVIVVFEYSVGKFLSYIINAGERA